MTIITFRPCPSCGRPLASDEVYRAGYDFGQNKHPMLKHVPPRGEYCDHIKEINAIERNGYL